PSGRYPLTLVRRTGKRKLSEEMTLVTIPTEDSEPQEEQRRVQPNRPLLAALTEGTGGKIDPDIHELVTREAGTRRLPYPLEPLLVPLAMMLFLVDVALRRLGRRR